MLQVTPTQTSPPRGCPRASSRPERCPAGHRGDIYLHGQRKRPDGIHARSRFRCLPSDGSPSHTFALAKRTPAHHHPDERSCPTCEHEAGRADGATAVPFYAFSVAEIARALVLVGQGISMREASQRVRFEADRYQADQSGRRTASRQNALSADYLDPDAAAAPTGGEPGDRTPRNAQGSVDTSKTRPSIAPTHPCMVRTARRRSAARTNERSRIP